MNPADRGAGILVCSGCDRAGVQDNDFGISRIAGPLQAPLFELVLDGGVWHGRQIVSAEWINQMTSRQSPQGFSFGSWRSYGYLWWQGRSSIDNHEIDWIGAVGRGGQRLYVAPRLRLVLAVTAGLYLESKDGAPSPLENLAGDTVLNSFALPAALGH